MSVFNACLPAGRYCTVRHQADEVIVQDKADGDN
jgi:hypothetical protein